MNRNRASAAWRLWAESGLGAAWIVIAALPLLTLLGQAGLASVLGASLPASLSPLAARAFRFGLEEALGSMAVALVIGLPGAWLVATYRFPGRRLLRAFAVIPFCMPPILIALGFVIWYGKSGVVNRVLMGTFALDEAPVSLLYSFAGLCLVQGLYNFPLVLDLVGSAWQGIPEKRTEAARSLGAGRFRAFASTVLPSLAPAIAEAAGFTFLFSFFSFVVVLVFGPPGSSTPETEIFRLLRFEGDLPGAAAIALSQTGLALGVLGLFSIVSSRRAASSSESGEGRVSRNPTARVWLAIAVYGLFLLLFFIGPILSIAASSFTVRRGLASEIVPSLASWSRLLSGGMLVPALVSTLVTALPAALLATLLGLALGSLLRRRRHLIAVTATLPLAISSVITAAGWKLLFPEAGLVVVVLIQALTALPFSLKSSASSLDLLSRETTLAARSLGAGRLRAFIGIELPSILPVTLSSAAFSFALAAGDATTPLVLGLPDFEPLPLAVYRLVGAYRYQEACAAGVLLALLSGIAFFVKDGGRRHA